MNFINRFAGLITGAIIGLLTPLLLSLIYPYYVTAHIMNEKKYPWLLTIPSTLILGTLIAIVLIPSMLAQLPISCVFVSKIGWRNGFVNALLFPDTFHKLFQNHLRTLSNIMPAIIEFWNLGPRLYILREKEYHQNKQNTKQNALNAKRSKPIVDQYLDIMIKAFIPPEKLVEKPSLGLTEQDVLDFKEAIDNATDKTSPEYQKHLKLYNYLKEEDEISMIPPTEIHNPVTQIHIDSKGESEIKTYEYEAFRKAFEIELKKARDEAETTERKNVELLMPNQASANTVEIYPGFYKELDVEHIHQVIRQWREEKNNSASLTLPPASTTDILRSTPPTTSSQEIKIQNQSTDPSSSKEKARQGFLTALQKRTVPQSTSDGTESLPNTSPTSPRNDKKSSPS